jgi:hypothetical protein
MARTLSTVKPTEKVLTQVRNGRTVIGPDARARVWRAFKLPAHMTISGTAWELMLQDGMGNDVGVVWQYTVPVNGAPMLWQRDAEYA